ncbi:MAG: phosphorylase family protein [Gammaproteobacteria bacterium]
MITGIIVALPEELVTLTSKRIEKGHCVFIGDKILATCSGAGASNAEASAQLLKSKGADRLISWGCAAGLSASVKPGDLILADRLIDADGNDIVVESDWYHHCFHALKEQTNGQSFVVKNGSLADSKDLVASSRDKKHLNAITGAVAIDMESAAIAKVAGLNKLGFLAIRAIADPATMDLPNAVGYSLNSQGDIILKKLLLFLALHPAELPGLIRLGSHFGKAKRTLKSVARQLESIADFNGSHELKTV